MVGLKSLVFLSVLAFATACLPILGRPKTDCGCHKKEPIVAPGPIIVPIGHPSPHPVRRESWVSLRYLVISIGDIVRGGRDILSSILKLDVAGTLDDVLEVVISLSRGVALIIDVILPGVGGLLVRLVIGIVRIIICILGSPSGLLGGILGPKRSGICVADYGCKWGWKRYDGRWSNHRDMLKHYELENVSVELDLIIKKCTKGRGVIALDSLSKLVYDHILILVNITIKSYDSWCKDDLVTVYVSLLVFVTTIGNSCKPGLGPLIVDEFESYCLTHLKNSGYKDISTYNSEIKRRTQSIRCWRWKGVIVSEEAKQSSSSENREYESSEQSEESRSSRNSSEEESERSRTSKSRSDESNASSECKKAERTKSDESSRDWSSENKKSESSKSDDASSESSKSKTSKSDQSSESSSDSQSRTSSDDQRSSDSDSSSGSRGKKTTEEISASAKESGSSSKKDSRDSSTVQTGQTQIDLKDATITETKKVETKSSSVQEEQAAYASEKQLKVKKTVEEGC